MSNTKSAEKAKRQSIKKRQFIKIRRIELSQNLRRWFLQMQKIQNQKQTAKLKPLRSPNLLNSSIYQSSISSRSNSTFTLISKVIMIVLELLLVLSLVIENTLDKKVTATQNQVDALEKNLQNKAPEITKIKNTINLINTYKKLRTEQPILSENINLILSSIPDSTILRHVRAQADSVFVSVDSYNPLDVAVMISIILEDKNVKQIILNKVDFDVAKNMYNSEINA